MYLFKIIIIFIFGTFMKVPTFSAKVKDVFLTGNASRFEELLKSNIELRIDSENVNYKTTKNEQATQILKLFFKKNPAKKFELEELSNKSSFQKFYTGKYITEENRVFKIYIVSETSPNKNQLIEKIQLRN